MQKSEDHSSLVNVRKPICLQCRDSVLECNGKSPCSNCDPHNRTCIYMPCPRGDACALGGCGYTHDGNVSVFNEPGRHVLGSSAALMPMPEAQKSTTAPVAAAQIEARRLLVVGLAYETTERDLKDFFKDFNIDYINFAWKGLTGFAFVDVHTPGEAETAIAQLNGGKLLGRKLKIELSSQPKLERCNDKEYDNAGMKGVGGGSAVMQQIPSVSSSHCYRRNRDIANWRTACGLGRTMPSHSQKQPRPIQSCETTISSCPYGPCQSNETINHEPSRRDHRRTCSEVLSHSTILHQTCIGCTGRLLLF